MRHKVIHRHIVAGSQPAVAIAVKQRAPRLVPIIRAARMPDAPIKNHRAAFGHANLHAAFGHFFAALAGKRIDQMRTGHRDKIPATRLRGIGQKERHLQGNPRARIRLDIEIEAPAILMKPQPRPVLLERLFRAGRRRHDHVRVVKLNIPIQQAPHLGKRLVPIEQFQKQIVPPDKIQHIAPRIRPHALALAIRAIHPIHHRNQRIHQILGQHLFEHEKPIALKLQPLRFGDTIIQTSRIHCDLLSVVTYPLLPLRITRHRSGESRSPVIFQPRFVLSSPPREGG